MGGMTFLETREPETGKTAQHEAPDGYEWASLDDSQVPLVCKSCGASITQTGRPIHDAWHAAGR